VRKRRAAPAVRPPTVGPRQRRPGATPAVKEHLDARTASTGRHAERTSAALPQRCQHALDVLARPKAIGSMVKAATGIGKALKAADFHLVDATATGAHTERPENRLLRLDRLDGEDLSAGAPAAQLDFVFVSGPPTLKRRAGEHGTGLAARTRRGPSLALRCRQRIRRPEAKHADTIYSASIGRPASRSISTRYLPDTPASPISFFSSYKGADTLRPTRQFGIDGRGKRMRAALDQSDAT
jgi:hypothetical protein